MPFKQLISMAFRGKSYIGNFVVVSIALIALEMFCYNKYYGKSLIWANMLNVSYISGLFFIWLDAGLKRGAKMIGAKMSGQRINVGVDQIIGVNQPAQILQRSKSRVHLTDTVLIVPGEFSKNTYYLQCRLWTILEEPG